MRSAAILVALATAALVICSLAAPAPHGVTTLVDAAVRQGSVPPPVAGRGGSPGASGPGSISGAGVPVAGAANPDNSGGSNNNNGGGGGGNNNGNSGGSGSGTQNGAAPAAGSNNPPSTNPGSQGTSPTSAAGSGPTTTVAATTTEVAVSSKAAVPTETTSGGGGGSNTGKIVGGIIGGLALLALLGGLLAFLLGKKKRNDSDRNAAVAAAAAHDRDVHASSDVSGPRGVEIAGTESSGPTGVGATEVHTPDHGPDEGDGHHKAAGAALAAGAGAAALGAKKHHDDKKEEDVVVPVDTPTEDAAPHDYVISVGPTQTNKEFDDIKTKFDNDSDNSAALGAGAYNRLGPAPAYAGSAATAAGVRLGGPRGALIAMPQRKSNQSEVAREAGYAGLRESDDYENDDVVGDSGVISDMRTSNPAGPTTSEETAGYPTLSKDHPRDGHDL